MMRNSIHPVLVDIEPLLTEVPQDALQFEEAFK